VIVQTEMEHSIQPTDSIYSHLTWDIALGISAIMSRVFLISMPPRPRGA